MRLVRKSDEVVFAENKVESAFNSLSENDLLKKSN